MKTQFPKLVLALALLSILNTPLSSWAQGTAFTYQGRLNASGSPANGSFDLTFSVWDAASGPSQIGTTQTKSAVSVSDGLFAVSLDFGAGIFTGAPRWLEIAVRPAASGSFTTLTSRQPVTAAPYAMFAQSLGTTDNQPLDLAVSGQRALRLEPNTNDTNGGPNVIGGWANNFVAAGVFGATIGGGGGNYFTGHTNRVTAHFGTVGGGAQNTSSGEIATVGGGAYNTSSGHGATVGGGAANTSSGEYGTVGGGNGNTISSVASYATICGGDDNSVGGAYSMAAGRYCNVPNSRSFMWSDGTLPFTSFTDNGFFALATGGFYFYTGNSVGLQVAGGGNAWSAISDRNVKENFAPVDTRAVLEKVMALPVTTWNLKTQSPEIRHIGAMAQDFKAAFAVGEDDRHISTSDADGVALAAIQGLSQKLGEELKRRDAENAELKQRVARLERLMKALMKDPAEPHDENESRLEN